MQDVSVIEDVEMPMIRKSNELLIQVRATSLNVIDTKICYGYSRIYRKLLNSVSELSQVSIDSVQHDIINVSNARTVYLRNRKNHL